MKRNPFRIPPPHAGERLGEGADSGRLRACGVSPSPDPSLGGRGIDSVCTQRARGMAMILAMMLVVSFAALLVALGMLTTHQADRTRNLRDASQRRLMLIAGQRAVDQYMPVWRATDRDKRIVVDLPRNLRQHGGKLTFTVNERAGGIQRDVMIQAELRGRSNAQRLRYGLVNGGWSVLRAEWMN